MNFEAQIFIPSFKIKIGPRTKSWIVSCLFILFLSLILHTFKNMSDGIRITLCICVCICLITPIFLSLFYFDTHELLNGELKGNLVIGKDFISFDGVKTEIQLIKNVHFNIYDYYEKIINSRSLQFYFPTLSQGVDNSIRFTTTNGKFYTVFFRLNSKYHRNDLNPFIAELIKHRIILLNEGIELMQLKTKEEIEELRNIILQ